MTRSDDETLVGNEVDRCLEEAGDRLHGADIPEWNKPSSRWAEAQFFMHRIALLDRLGTTRAAAYLRKELLDAIANDRRDGDSATLKALGFDPRVQNITVTKPSGSNPYRQIPSPDSGMVMSGGMGITYQDLINMYSQVITKSARYSGPLP